MEGIQLTDPKEKDIRCKEYIEELNDQEGKPCEDRLDLAKRSGVYYN